MPFIRQMNCMAWYFILCRFGSLLSRVDTVAITQGGKEVQLKVRG